MTPWFEGIPCIQQTFIEGQVVCQTLGWSLRPQRQESGDSCPQVVYAFFLFFGIVPCFPRVLLRSGHLSSSQFEKWKKEEHLKRVLLKENIR